MQILYRKTKIQITTIPQLLDYINLNVNRSNIKWLDVKPSVKDKLSQWVSSDVEIRHKKLYSQFKNIIGSKANRVFQLDFYLDRGYSLEYANAKVSEEQSKRSKKAAANGAYHKSNRLLPSHIEYWINKGFNLEESKSKVKARQTTFTLQKCIDKFGLDAGTKRWQERQDKWQSNIDYSKFSTAVTWDKWYSKFPNFREAFYEWVTLAINKRASTYSNSNILDELLVSDIKSNRELKEYCLQSPLGLDLKESILSVIGMNKLEWKESWLEFNGAIINNHVGLSGVWGNHYYRNGNYYESDGELTVGLILEANNIQFNLHKYYPNSDYKYDFYLPDVDIYIEWIGMSDLYYTEKKKELMPTNLNIIWTRDIVDIKKLVKKLR